MASFYVFLLFVVAVSTGSADDHLEARQNEKITIEAGGAIIGVVTDVDQARENVLVADGKLLRHENGPRDELGKHVRVHRKSGGNALSPIEGGDDRPHPPASMSPFTLIEDNLTLIEQLHYYGSSIIMPAPAIPNATDNDTTIYLEFDNCSFGNVSTNSTNYTGVFGADSVCLDPIPKNSDSTSLESYKRRQQLLSFTGTVMTVLTVFYAIIIVSPRGLASLLSTPEQASA